MLPSQTANVERRAHPRRRVLKTGKIVFNDGRSVIDCTVRDISEGGARLACAQPNALPDLFQIVFVNEREMRDARVAWRGIGQLGVAFLSGPRKPLRLVL